MWSQRINVWKTLAKHISCDCKCKSDVRKCNLDQKWNNGKSQCECKNPIKHCVCKEDYAWNPSTCACKCDKHCNIDEYLENCHFAKSITDDLVITCDEIIDTPEPVLVNSNDKKTT